MLAIELLLLLFQSFVALWWATVLPEKPEQVGEEEKSRNHVVYVCMYVCVRDVSEYEYIIYNEQMRFKQERLQI